MNLCKSQAKYAKIFWLREKLRPKSTFLSSLKSLNKVAIQTKAVNNEIKSHISSTRHANYMSEIP